jgi:hypothetical protein
LWSHDTDLHPREHSDGLLPHNFPVEINPNQSLPAIALDLLGQEAMLRAEEPSEQINLINIRSPTRIVVERVLDLAIPEKQVRVWAVAEPQRRLQIPMKLSAAAYES